VVSVVVRYFASTSVHCWLHSENSPLTTIAPSGR